MPTRPPAATRAEARAGELRRYNVLDRITGKCVKAGKTADYASFASVFAAKVARPAAQKS